MSDRLIHELACGRKVWRANLIGTQLTERKQVSLPPPKVHCYVTADDVASWYWGHEKENWSLYTDNPFGVCRPPFS